MKGHVRKSVQADVDWLKDNLRPEDAAEVTASHGSPQQAMQESFDASDECWTIIVSDTQEIAGMYGVCRQDNITGVIWLLTAPPITKVWLPFLRGSRKWVKEMNKKYPLLTNAVDEEYKVSIDWLRFLGFTFLKRHETWGVGTKPFLEFVRIDNG